MQISAEDRTQCTACPLNTIPSTTSGITKCDLCDSSQYRFVGPSPACLSRLICPLESGAHFAEVFPATNVIDSSLRCGNPQATTQNIIAKNISTFWKALQPSPCTVSVSDIILGKPIRDCIPCPKGTLNFLGIFCLFFQVFTSKHLHLNVFLVVLVHSFKRAQNSVNNFVQATQQSKN